MNSTHPEVIQLQLARLRAKFAMQATACLGNWLASCLSLMKLVNADGLCLKDPAAEVFVGELGDSSINIFCRPWVKSDDYWTVYWGLTGKAKEQFDAEGISIPFPQRDVHIYQNIADDS